MLALFAALALPQQQPLVVPLDRPGIDGRGRDPWVFRCIFEDRTRMVIIAPAPGWWMAFNPETCAVHKVWQGKMDFKGKVWDFSQDNSRAEGAVYYASPSEIMRLPDDGVLPLGWMSQGVTSKKGNWEFDVRGGTLTGPAIDGSGWQRVFVAFDEQGRKGHLRVNINDDKLKIAPQWFESALSVEGETNWQWNFKRVERPTGAMRLQIKNSNNAPKALRNLRMYGDRPSWFEKDKPLEVRWRGYDLVGQTKGVVLRYDVIVDGKPVSVESRPELTKEGWAERLTVKNVPRGHALTVRCEGVGPSVRVGSDTERREGAWQIARDGDHVLSYTILPSKRPQIESADDVRKTDVADVSGPALPVSETQQDSTINGLAVWVWDVDGKLERHAKVGEGQVPNYYRILPIVDTKDGFDADDGPIRDSFIGRAYGWLRVKTAGRYNLRLTCDDGAKLLLDGKVVLDTERGANFADETGTELRAGDIPIEIPFYEDAGNFKLKLEWKTPGSTSYQVVPTEALRTEPGQTFVTNPGTKRWFYEADPRQPGDGRPLEGVHPGYRLETIRPPGFAPAVGGLAFLPDGRLALCTWDQVGAVHIISGLDGPADQVKLSTYAEGLGEPLGIRVIDGDIWVTQKGEVTRLRDTDHDGKADSFDAMAGGWPASHNYHEFTFNLVPKGDKVYLSTSVPLRGGWTYYNPGSAQAYPIPDVPGSILELDPKTGAWSVFANGVRTPNGMGLGVDGELFVCDNQGSWLPCSKLIHVRKGGFYGHQQSPDGTRKSDPPALWLPHGEVSNSPSEPVLVPSGPFKGQMLFGDVTYGGIQRCNLEKIDGVYQGAVFRMTQGIEAGVNRLAWGPDGCLYIGGIGSNGNWNHKEHRFGLQRLVPNGETTFEIKEVHATPTGFSVDFTQPFVEMSTANVEMSTFRYDPKELYGGPKVDVNRFTPRRVLVSEGNTRAWFEMPEMKPGYVYSFRFVGLKNASGAGLWSTEAWYTLNKVPKTTSGQDARRPDVGGTSQTLFDGKTLDGWKQRNGTASYTVENGEIVGRTVAGSPNSFLCTEKMYSDFELELEVKTDTSLNSGIQIRSMSVPGYQNGRVHGYQIEVDPSERAWSGGLYDESRRGWLADLSKDEKARKAFKNGQWNKYRILAEGDHFRTWVNGIPCVDAKDDLTKWGFIALQVHNNEKSGLEVRWRNMKLREIKQPEFPVGAKWILRSPGDEQNWVSEAGGPCPWKWVDGGLETGGGNILSKESLGDCRLHVEFMTDENGKGGQENGNSGVYLMQSYELQILNSAPRGPADNECGGIYTIKAPDYAMAFKAGEWQTYDVEFHAPKWEGDKKVADARMTVYHNGTLIHRNVALPKPTGAGKPEAPGLRPLRLQDHGNKVKFRNVWLQPL